MIRTEKPWSALQKPATRLADSQPDIVHVDGVRWDIAEGPDGKLIEQGVFRDAYVQPSKVQDVFLVIMPFSDKPGGFPGHAQLTFEMQPDAPIVDSLGNQDSALAISMEVHFRQGESWNPVPDQENPQPIIYQLGTGADAKERAISYYKYPLQRYRLKLSPTQKEQLLRERLEESTKDNSETLYHPTKNSCLSTLIDAVNLVVPDQQKISHDEPNAKVPVWANKVFYKHRLLDRLSPDETISVPK